ncbi:MAG: NADH-quinone oxidoreductase subunit L [Alphaproteobacteria bacterium]|nr:NADH-quinone oxidoreductase subunit L [Alphaproteobacteria bacterium]
MELLAVFSPLAGFLIAFLFGRQVGDKGAQFVTCAGVIVAAIASVVLFSQVNLADAPYSRVLSEWIVAGDFVANWGLRIDQLSVVMMCVVNVVSACVHIYSIGYMSHDEHKARFFAYLSLFTFAMLMLVSADNLIQLFFGWEGVGLTSYLLIGFWNHRHSANAAANKAFVVNRVGDFGFVLGIFSIFLLFDSVQFETIFELAPQMAGVQLEFLGITGPALTIIGLLLFVGAVAKSAQLGLHTWLPDAMEGPTPVSALIHAATMVTAGVFLVARFSPLYEYAPEALMVICVAGGLTAFVAATIGMTQFDIKRVIAYSTMSQLGYMFFALGVSAYGAAMFHLVTHAFFKALLFLGAGSVIHAMSDEQDMRRMGGIWKHVPATYVMMWVGALALAGMPFFAGFYSKDIVLEAAWADHTWFGMFAFWMGIAAAFMTAFYSWRLILMTFHGRQRADEKVMAHIHESPNVMLMPLVVLAVGSIMAGSAFYGGFVGSPSDEVVMRDGQAYVSAWNKEHFWGESLHVLPQNDTVEAAHHVPLWVKALPVVVGLFGIFCAYVFYLWREGLPERLAGALRPVHQLFYRKWYFDELYDLLFVRGSWSLGLVFSKKGDGGIDRFGPDGFALVTWKIGALLRRMQTGYVFHYALVMMIGLIGIVSWLVIRSGGVVAP